MFPSHDPTRTDHDAPHDGPCYECWCYHCSGEVDPTEGCAQGCMS